MYFLKLIAAAIFCYPTILVADFRTFDPVMVRIEGDGQTAIGCNSAELVTKAASELQSLDNPTLDDAISNGDCFVLHRSDYGMAIGANKIGSVAVDLLHMQGIDYDPTVDGVVTLFFHQASLRTMVGNKPFELDF